MIKRISSVSFSPSVTQVFEKQHLFAHKKPGIDMSIFKMFIVMPLTIPIFSVQQFVNDLIGTKPFNLIRMLGQFLFLDGLFSLGVSQPISK
jgi:hypothetical protein